MVTFLFFGLCFIFLWTVKFVKVGIAFYRSCVISLEIVCSRCLINVFWINREMNEWIISFFCIVSGYERGLRFREKEGREYWRNFLILVILFWVFIYFRGYEESFEVSVIFKFLWFNFWVWKYLLNFVYYFLFLGVLDFFF